jgi:hypothetical protein
MYRPGKQTPSTRELNLGTKLEWPQKHMYYFPLDQTLEQARDTSHSLKPNGSRIIRKV